MVLRGLAIGYHKSEGRRLKIVMLCSYIIFCKSINLNGDYKNKAILIVVIIIIGLRIVGSYKTLLCITVDEQFRLF